MGKTRLAEECLARAVQAGFTGGRATASAAAAAVPLGAIAHLIPRGLDLSDPGAGFAAVARALSEPSGDRQRVLLVDDLQWLDAASAMLLRQLLDAGVVRLIGTMRTEGPVGAAVAQRHQPGACPKARPGRALAAGVGTCPSALVTRAGAE